MMQNKGSRRTFFIHTFGCQMNQADSAIISALLKGAGHLPAQSEAEADLVLLNTCAVRENAVDRVAGYLEQLRGAKRRRKGLLVGLVGCVPQYRREELFERFPMLDLLAGPDTYRGLPALVEEAERGARPAALRFDTSETYEGVDPLRPDAIGAFLPVMRGCNNMCAYCVVPFTRGRERSHPFDAVLREARSLEAAGFREVTLLGQNVNSYADPLSGRGFAELLDAVARVVPTMRVRFTTSHPKDISPDLVETIARHSNLCNHIHLPVQSGSTSVLRRMNRGHSIEEYLRKVELIRSVLPDASITTDIIAGFCGESAEEHRATLSLLETVRYDSAFMFHYSTRPGTPAAGTLPDDVPDEVKKARLQEIIALQTDISRERNERFVGRVVEVLAEAESRRSPDRLMGRTPCNRSVVFDRQELLPGQLAMVAVTSATSATLSGSVARNS